MNQRLYKAKADHNGEWVVGYYLEVAGIPYILPEGKPLNDIVQVRPETVCQEIGMKDMEGTPIFESDIVRDMESPDLDWTDENVIKGRQGVVALGQGCFDSGIYLYSGFFYVDGYGECEMNELYERRCKEHIKVIGNIHDKEGKHA